MTKTKHGDELISEGCRSYHKALYAVMQFRKQVQAVIRTAVDDHASQLAAALALSESELKCAANAKPAQYQGAFDGSEAEVGLLSEHENWEISYYVWVGDEEDPFFGAMLWLKNPGSTIATIGSAGDEDLEVGDDYIQLYEYFPADRGVDLGATCDRVLRRWIDLWTKVGGLQQFLPQPKKKKPRAELS
jgi:hypothetical protein